MKKILKVALIIILAFIIFSIIAPAKLGKITYDSAVAIESRLYGVSEHKIDIGEMEISYYKNKLSSDKETLLLLHGFSSDKVVWLRFARYFTDQYNVIIPDMAGHGKTGYSKNWDYRIPAQVSRLIKFLEQLQINKVHVIGNSMGGFISAHFAFQHPDKTLSATLVDPAGIKSPVASNMDNMLAKNTNPFKIYTRSEFDTFYAMTMASPPWLPDFIFAAFYEQYQNRREELMHIFSDYHGKDMLDGSLDKINIPVLLLWGEEDRLIHVSSVEVWQSGIKGIKVKTWPGIGHMPMFEMPGESADVVQQFLQGLD